MMLKMQRRELFAQYVAGGMSGANAAIEAGYSENGARTQAARLLANAAVALRVKEIAERRAKDLNISAEWVIEKLVDVHNEAVKGQPVLDRYGKPTGSTIKNLSAANRALELIGKSDGIAMFTDKSESKVSGDPVASLLESIKGRSRRLPEDSTETILTDGTEH